MRRMPSKWFLHVDVQQGFVACLLFKSVGVFAQLRRYAETLYGADAVTPKPYVCAAAPKPIEYVSVCFIVHVACLEQVTEVQVARHQF